jgi:hypothetical protein
MAKIPSFNPSNRLELAPTQTVNPRAARRKGEALQGLSQGVTQFTANLDQYLEKKKQVDDALALAKMNQQFHEAAIKGEEFAKTNPDGARDGSTVQKDFGAVY